MNRSLAILGIASLTCASALFAQSSTPKSGSTKKSAAGAAKDPAAVKRGHDVFQEKCSICHFDTSEEKKIGPGLKGLNKRGTCSVNGTKVTDENLKTWIENGDSLMPPFKEALEEAQKTLSEAIESGEAYMAAAAPILLHELETESEKEKSPAGSQAIWSDKD